MVRLVGSKEVLGHGSGSYDRGNGEYGTNLDSLSKHKSTGFDHKVDIGNWSGGGGDRVLR